MMRSGFLMRHMAIPPAAQQHSTPPMIKKIHHGNDDPSSSLDDSSSPTPLGSEGDHVAPSGSSVSGCWESYTV